MINPTIYAECLQLITTLWDICDRGPYERLLEIMTPDCRWRRQGRWYEGTANIIAYLQRFRDTVARHTISNVMVEQRGTDLVVRYCVVTFHTKREEGAAEPYSIKGTDRLVDNVAICARSGKTLLLKELSQQQIFDMSK